MGAQVGVMGAGRLVFQGTVAELRSRGEPRIAIRTTQAVAAAQVLAKLGLAEIATSDDEVSARMGDHAPEQGNADLVHASVPLAVLATQRPSLEDLFLAPNAQTL